MEYTADRGGIYEFIESDGRIKNRVLVISNQSRNRDNLVSILRLSPVGNGNDAVAVDYDSKTGEYWYVHCGCVSYAYRNRLGKKTGEVFDGTMKRVDNLVREQLGLSEETTTYKKLYDELMDKLIERGFKEDKEND